MPANGEGGQEADVADAGSVTGKQEERQGGRDRAEAEAEAIGALAAMARAVFVGVWQLDGMCAGIGKGGDTTSQGAITDGEVEGVGFKDPLSRRYEIVVGYSKDVEGLLICVERMLTAEEGSGWGVGGSADRHEAGAVMETADQVLTQLLAHVKVQEADDVAEKEGGSVSESPTAPALRHSDEDPSLEDAIDAFLSNTSPSSCVVLSRGAGRSAKEVLSALPDGMARRAAAAKDRLGRFAAVESELQQCHKDLWRNALDIREKTQEMEALRVQVQVLAAQERKGGEVGSALRQLQKEFDQYKGEAEETINALIEKEDALRKQLQSAHASADCVRGGGVGNGRGPADGDRSTVHREFRPGGSGDRGGGREAGEGMQTGLLSAHVAAMRRSVSVLRSRQAKAAVLRQLPPLDVSVGTRAGAETPAAAAPSDAAKGVDRAAEVCETQVSMSCGGRDERKELARKDTRAVAVAFCKEAQHLQKLLLKASVAPQVVSLSGNRTAGGVGGGVRQQYAEVSSRLRSLARATTGLQGAMCLAAVSVGDL